MTSRGNSEPADREPIAVRGVGVVESGDLGFAHGTAGGSGLGEAGHMLGAARRLAMRGEASPRTTRADLKAVIAATA